MSIYHLSQGFMPNPRGNEASLKKYQPKWKSGATHTIRVPIALTDAILEYARQLDDSNTIQSATDQGLNHMSQVIELLIEVHDHAPRNSFGKEWRSKVAQAIELLQT